MRTTLRAALLATCLPSGAWAQTEATTTDQTTPPAPGEPAAGGIQDIVVTARKTEETLQSAPVSVSATTAEKIQTLGLNSIDDIARQSTGVSFSQAFGRSSDRPVIRGQSNVLANVQFGVETGAAYFVDGIYYQGDIQGFDPETLERVEVIKGPQSALYGRNTYAGAINFITKGPSERLTVSGRASYAEYDERAISASISGPIMEGVGFRVGGRYYRYDGQYRNQLTGKKVGSEGTDFLYGVLDADGGDLHVRIRGQYQRDRDGPLPIFLQGAAANNCLPGFRSARYRTRSATLPFIPATLGASTNTNQYFCGVIKPQPNGVRLNTDPIPITIPAFTTPAPGLSTLPVSGTFDGTAFDGIYNKQYYASGIIDYDIGGSGFTLSSLSGYRHNENLFGADSDHSESFFFFNLNPAFGAAAGGSYPNPLVSEPAFANTNRKVGWDFSQEVRLSTPDMAWGRALAGVYYFKQVQRGTDLTFANPRFGDRFGGPGSSFNWLEDRAVFGLVEVKPFAGFSITGEVRHQVEKKKTIDASALTAGATVSATNFFCAGYGPGNTAFPIPSTGCSAEYKETGTDPRVTVSYETPGGTLLYGVYAQGRKPGGFNGSAGVTAGLTTGTPSITYLPEKSKGFEVGLKFDALGRTLRGSVALYDTKLSDVQLTTAIPNLTGTGAVTSIVTNQGNARSKGFELELTVAPSRNLTVSTGMSYTDAKFTSGCDFDLFILNSGGLRPNFNTRNAPAAALPLCSIAGKKLPLGSPWIINGSATWTLPVSDTLNVWTNVNYSYEDQKFIQTDNLAKTGDTFLLNARIGVRTGQFSLAVFGRNLTAEDSIPLATRWFDYRYGGGATGLPAAGPPPFTVATQPFNGSPAVIETGAPRAFFATLRRGRTFGVEGTFNF